MMMMMMMMMKKKYINGVIDITEKGRV